MTNITDKLVASEVHSFDRENVKKYAKQILKKILFIGTFQEKRFVQPINGYRDVVFIATEEEDFIKNILIVKKRIDQVFFNTPWVGITLPGAIGAPEGYNLWVELPQEVFGKYWYKVKTVEFLDQEIRLKLEIVRPVKRDFTPSRSDEKSYERFDLNASIQDVPHILKDILIYFYKHILTISNIKETVIFISLLVVTIIAGCINTIKYLLEYVLQLLREISGLIKTTTPIIVHLMNVFAKLVFGLYHMIVLLIHGKPKPQSVYNSYFNVDPQLIFPDHRQRYNQYSDRAVPYYPYNRRSKVAITPIED